MAGEFLSIHCTQIAISEQAMGVEWAPGRLGCAGLLEKTGYFEMLPLAGAPQRCPAPLVP